MPTHIKTMLGLAGLAGISALAFALAAQTPSQPSKTPTPSTPGGGTPKIEFSTNFFDFGAVTGAETVSGSFKFKNIGDGVLKLGRPEPTCGCTDAKVTPDTLAPGQTGLLTYTIKLEHAMITAQKHIRVHSNDPQNPDVMLTMQVTYKPLYELTPLALRINVPPGQDTARASFTVTRTDGKPLQVGRLKTAPDWITAALDSSCKPGDTSARIQVILRRPAEPPSMIVGTVQMLAAGQPASRPVQTMLITGEFQSELAASPPRLYWVIPDFGNAKSNYPAEALTRTVELKSVLGHDIRLAHPSTDIQGLSVSVVSKDPGKLFDLVLKFNELPQGFTNGKVTVETSLASLPKLEVPLTIATPSGN